MWPAGLLVRTGGGKGHEHSAKDTSRVHSSARQHREQGSVSRVSRVSSLPPTSGVALVEPRLD